MNSEFLSDYHIPFIAVPETQSKKDVPIPVHPPNKPPTLAMSAKRFLAPGKEIQVLGSAKSEARVPVKMIGEGSGITAAVSQRPLMKRKLVEQADMYGNQVVMFQGRDESYPAELNKMIQPLCCELCKSQMTSMKSAKDHYESKSHDRHISAWLAKNYTEAGLETPPIKRLVKQGPTGPNAFHCNLCDLALTSMTHARQHFAGRKHQLVAQYKTKPSGAGYYKEGKWVRTATKLCESVSSDGRFGIGELFKTLTPMVIQEPTKEENNVEQQLDAKSDAIDESLTCKICKISVTSATQIKMHLDGAKHQKNLRKQGQEEEPPSKEQSEQSSSSPPLNEEGGRLPMYRTPSGSYYCKLCNIAMNHITILQQHLLGRKHLKNSRQAMEQSNIE